MVFVRDELLIADVYSSNVLLAKITRVQFPKRQLLVDALWINPRNKYLIWVILKKNCYECAATRVCITRHDDEFTSEVCFVPFPQNFAFIVRAANPMLFRSSAATTKRTKTNGMIRAFTLRTVL